MYASSNRLPLHRAPWRPSGDFTEQIRQQNNVGVSGALADAVGIVELRMIGRPNPYPA
jgi:hypothetical protein